MKREREAFVEEALDWEYRKALAQDAIPWNDAEGESMELTPREVRQLEKALEETFPEPPDES